MKYAVTWAKARSYSAAASSLKVSSPAILSPLHTADHPLYSEEPPGGSTDQIAEIRAEWADARKSAQYQYGTFRQILTASLADRQHVFLAEFGAEIQAT